MLAVAIVLLLVYGYERYALSAFGVVAFSLSAVLLIGGIVWTRGDLKNIMVSATDLVVTGTDIWIGATEYPLARVTELDFLVEGYDGMQGPDWDSPTEGVLDGTKNYLCFVFDGREVKCRFYLPNAAAMQQLGGLYKELYAARVPFVERSWKSRTFLFEEVGEG